MLDGAVQPVRRWLRCRPRMPGAYMVGNHVQQHLQPELMGRGDQFLIVLHRAEVIFNGIFIHCAIAVVIRSGVVIVIQGREP